MMNDSPFTNRMVTSNKRVQGLLVIMAMTGDYWHTHSTMAENRWGDQYTEVLNDGPVDRGELIAYVQREVLRLLGLSVPPILTAESVDEFEAIISGAAAYFKYFDKHPGAKDPNQAGLDLPEPEPPAPMVWHTNPTLD